MNYQDLLRDNAAELGVPEDEFARFADRLLRFQIRAGREQVGDRVGRFGGLPELPVGMPWPAYKEPLASAGEPLPFMFSLDCAALPRVPDLPLPADGSLLFFVDPESAKECGTMSIEREQACAEVVYVPAGTPTEEAAQPAVEPEEAAKFLIPEQALYATVQADVYRDPTDIFTDFEKDLISDLPHFAELCALIKRTLTNRAGGPATVLIGGFTLSAQDSPEYLMAEEADDFDEFDDSEEAEFAMVRKYLPLAQFQSPFEEFHEARFLIPREALAAKRFEETLSFCEFTE